MTKDWVSKTASTAAQHTNGTNSSRHYFYVHIHKRSHPRYPGQSRFVIELVTSLLDNGNCFWSKAMGKAKPRRCESSGLPVSLSLG